MWRNRLFWAWVGVTAFLIACSGGNPNVPTPIPTPRITPTPVLHYFPPLVPTSGGFVDGSGKPIRLKGASYFPPDSKRFGWPSRVSGEKLRELSQSGIRLVATRLGPFIASMEGSEHVAYLDVGGRVDLGQWNESFWLDMDSFLFDAASLGIYVELDTIDGWSLKNRITPWSKEHNINGVDEGDCTVVGRAVSPTQRKWLTKVAELANRHPNVILQISNESTVGSCGREFSSSWELEVYSILKSLTSRPVGTNSEDPEVERSVDYFERHSCMVSGASGRPGGVNEWNCSLSAVEFCSKQKEALDRGGWFLLWGDGMDPAIWEEALKCPG